jgi:hypothetical protein
MMYGAKSLLGAATLLALPSFASAALVLQTDAPNYTLNPDGVTTTAVNVYLAQTGGTTTLSSEGGINQFEVSLSVTAPAAGDRPALALVTVNPQFTGNKTQNIVTSVMGGSFFDFISGVAPIADRVFLGTYSFTGSASVPETTYSISAPVTSGYTFTALGSDLGGQITPGTFTVVVPEPGAMVLLGLAGVMLVSRRRAME